jgi:hypothetical protein
MTVAELKALLNRFPDDMEVVKSQNSGDYWGTKIVRDIVRVAEDTCVYSAYHECFKIMTEDSNDFIDENDGAGDEQKEFVIL